MRELEPGLWHWEAPHPEWGPSSDWPQVVSSYAIDDGERLLLFDPLAVPVELVERAGDRETVVVLTVAVHERDSRSLAERLGVPVYLPEPDEGSPDVAWVLTEGRNEGHLYAPGDRLPPGVDAAFSGRQPNDLVLWVESRRAVVAGDSLVDFGDALEIREAWLGEGVSREQVADGLRPLLEFPVEHVLVTHGAPTDVAALRQALS